MVLIAYCLKEKAKHPVKNPVEEINARGSMVARGTCSSCGTKMYLMLSDKNASAELIAKRDKFKAKKGGASKKSHKSPKSVSKKSRRSKKSPKSASKKSRKSKKSPSKKSRKSKK